MFILVLKEKHGDVYLEWPIDSTAQEELCRDIIKKRMMNGFYEENNGAEEAFRNNRCKRFLFNRVDYEYENLEVVEVDKSY
jgi:hypothetical protein